MEKYLYEDLYSLEERHFWHIAKREMCCDLIKGFAFPGRKIRILDVGCGTGKNVEVFGQFGESFGIDNEPLAVQFCRKRGLQKVKISSSERIKHRSGLFDLVTMLDVLEHVDEKITLSEVKRVMKPGGLLIITVPAYQWLWSAWDVALHHRKRYTRGSLSKVLVTSGFTIIHTNYMYSFLLIPVICVRVFKSFMFKTKKYPSDFKLSSPILNRVMLTLARVERIMSKIFPPPFGTSIVCIAKFQ